jgi:hypothetical protein
MGQIGHGFFHGFFMPGTLRFGFMYIAIPIEVSVL